MGLGWTHWTGYRHGKLSSAIKGFDTAEAVDPRKQLGKTSERTNERTDVSNDERTTNDLTCGLDEDLTTVSELSKSTEAKKQAYQQRHHKILHREPSRLAGNVDRIPRPRTVALSQGETSRQKGTNKAASSMGTA